MSRIAFIPIDNRPVCCDLPVQIINQAKEHEIIMPDINFLGDLTKIADVEALFKWLETLEKADIFVVSLDTIAYGGLIPSRRSCDDFKTIKERIDKFVEIIKKLDAKVYAFSSIMRISNNNINEEEKEYWNEYGTKIFEYSFNLHKSEVEGIKAPEQNIPPEIIKDYLDTRKRNFEINKYYIDLYRHGIFDTLVFSKDDCSEYGLNVKEANELKVLSRDCKNVFIKTGADEIPLTLLSRAVNLNKKIKIAPVYTNPDGKNKISKYEDITAEESVKSQIELAGGITADENNCDLVLLVNNFSDEQGELVMNVNVPLFDKELTLPVKPYFIADIMNANGSDNNFVNKLLKLDFSKNFYGYSAWNTTGNTLGCAISVALTYFGAEKPDKNSFINIQTVRFLDDWAYQANVRKKIRDDNNNLNNNIIKNEMRIFEKTVFDKLGLKDIHIKYEFPWNRFFEIRVKCLNN